MKLIDVHVQFSKKRTSKKSRRGTFQEDLTRANITWDGSSSLASSWCPIYLLAREELSLS